MLQKVGKDIIDQGLKYFGIASLKMLIDHIVRA